MPSLPPFAKVPRLNGNDPDFSLERVCAEAHPVIIEGLLSEWPLFQAAQLGDAEALAELREQSLVERIKVVEAPASMGGHLFYLQGLRKFTFERRVMAFEQFCERLLSLAAQTQAPTLALQTANSEQHFKDFDSRQSLALLPDVPSRIWIGNRAIVATHHDDAENLAAVVCGRRRFTLFPPEQVRNLYIGPLDHTPAGAPVSLASPLNPDFERYPRFRDALAHACVAELEPGDTLYIPTLWWHHVESLSDVNILVNYWWGGAIGGQQDTSPQALMMLARHHFQSLPEQTRAAWLSMFKHYVFDDPAMSTEHIPEANRGLLGTLDEAQLAALRRMVSAQAPGD